MRRRLALLTTLCFALLLSAPTAITAPPDLVNYQGVLRDAAGKPLSGSFDMMFVFYDGEAGGNQIMIDFQRVTVSGGLFNVHLGGGSIADGAGPGVYLIVSAMFRDFGQVWMQIEISPSGAGTFEILSPRVRVVSAPYALNAAALDGKSATQFLDTTAGSQSKTGKIGVGGAAAPTHALTATSTADDDTLRLIGPGAFGSQARLNFGDADFVYIAEDEDDKLTLRSNRTALLGGPVGILNTNPTVPLDVSGFIRSSAGFMFPDGTLQTTSSTAGLRRTPRQIGQLNWFEANQSVPAVQLTSPPFAASFDGDHVWVLTLFNSPVGLHKIRASDNTVVATHAVSGADGFSIAFDGANIWVPRGGSVRKVRASDGIGVDYATGGDPDFLAFDGTNLWIGDISNDRLVKMRPSDGVIVAQVPLGTAPGHIISDGTNIWVVLRDLSAVRKIRASDNAVLGTFTLTGFFPYRLAFDGTHVWTTSEFSGSVAKLRATDGTVAGTFSLPWPGTSLVYDGFHIWVAIPFIDSLVKLRALDGVSLGTFAVGGKARTLVFDGSSVWMTLSDQDRVAKM